MTCCQSLLETVGISRHFRGLPSGNSSSHRNLLPAFDAKGSKHKCKANEEPCSFVCLFVCLFFHGQPLSVTSTNLVQI